MIPCEGGCPPAKATIVQYIPHPQLEKHQSSSEHPRLPIQPQLGQYHQAFRGPPGGVYGLTGSSRRRGTPQQELFVCLLC